jgi:hypothetical protein
MAQELIREIESVSAWLARGVLPTDRIAESAGCMSNARAKSGNSNAPRQATA